MHAVFDLDGVIIDSRQIVLDSYREAGVEPPDDILAREGEAWIALDMTLDLTAIAMVKAKKNLAYLHRIECGPLSTLPPYALACLMAQLGHEVHLLSGAPHGTLDRLRPRLPMWPFRTSADGIRTPMKMALIRALPNVTAGVYVDDQDKFIDLPANWRFVRYTGQDIHTIRREVLECISA